MLAIALLGVYAAALRVIWRSPFRALGILVAGMAVHSVLLMFLLRLTTPSVVVRLLQAWKEGILLLLLALAIRLGLRAWRDRRMPPLAPMDWVMAAFTVVILVYFALPPSLFGSQVTTSQRLLGARVLLTLPLLYLLGRVFFSTRREDLVWNLRLIAGAAAFVAVAGLVELFLIPTRAWLDGGVNLLSAWLGFTYHGPAGLPENFFQTIGQGLYLRRMVSTYVSPLPIAYTGLLVVPVAVGLILSARPVRREQLVPVALLALLVLGIVLSVTRLAIGLMIPEFLLLALLWWKRWILWATLVVVTLALAAVLVYPRVGPLVGPDLKSVPVHPHGLSLLSRGDSSFNEHSTTLSFDLQYVLQHPLGSGLGTSIHRFGQSQGTGESAYFDVFGEAGVVAGLLYTGAYGMFLVFGLRAWRRHRGDPLPASIALVALVGGLALIPITLTSDVWSELSVTYLLWWAAGYSVSLASSRW